MKSNIDFSQSDLLRGHTETIILSMLAKEDTYGYAINRFIRQRTNTSGLKEATLYMAFRRLEAQGAIQSYRGSASAGARRRYYRITSKGRQLLQTQLSDWYRLREWLDVLLQEEE